MESDAGHEGSKNIIGFPSKLDPATEKKVTRATSTLLVLFCFFIPLKLSLAYCSLYPFLLVSLYWRWRSLLQVLSANSAITTSFAAFLVIAVIASITGIDPLRSFANLPSVLIYSLLAPAVAAHSLTERGKSDIIRAALALVFGQTLAALHSVYNSALDDGLPKFLIGSVTESGQLSLVLPFAVGILLHTVRTEERRHLQLWGMGALSLSISIATGFAQESYRMFAVSCSLVFFLTLGHWLLRSNKNETISKARLLVQTLAWLALPLLVGALLVNLKRGPWLGVACGMFVFLLFANRKLIFPVLLAGSLAIAGLTPIQNRLVASTKDFFMRGGRNDIWQIGSELIQRYPLGIGYKNSSFLQKFDSAIPPELKHFHSNFLNILVETGWLGLAAYAMFLCVIIRLAFTLAQGKNKIICTAIGVAFVSWQVAGLVEYSFGDSEVVLVSYFLLGLLMALNLGGNQQKVSPA